MSFASANGYVTLHAPVNKNFNLKIVKSNYVLFDEDGFTSDALDQSLQQMTPVFPDPEF